MAGMFYTLIEVAEKLNKTEEEIKQMVKDGQLREFRDGSKLLFKKDEVDALTSDTGDLADDTLGIAGDTSAAEGSTLGLSEDAQQTPEPQASEVPIEEPAEQDFDLELDASGLDMALGGSDLDLDLAASRAGELDLEPESLDDQPLEEQPQEDIPLESEPIEQQPELEAPIEPEPVEQAPDFEQEEIPMASEEPIAQDQEPAFEEDIPLTPEGPAAQEEQPVFDEDLSLAPEQPAQPQPSAEESEIELSFDDLGDTGAAPAEPVAEESAELSLDTDLGLGPVSDEEGTKLGAEGINVLGDTEGYDITADSLGETAEVSLEGDLDEPALDEDVNLESFGSGSGLLDLSLQADDTSLGAVLDDIIPGEGGAAAADAASPMDLAAEMDEVAEDIAPSSDAEQADSMMPEIPVAQPGAPLVAAYAEPAPDASSNVFGIMLLVPLIALAYAAIIISAAIKDVTPGILTATQGYILYIVIGLAVLAIILMFVGIAAGGSAGPKTKKAKTAKPKKVKKAKPPKKAKPKKEKKPKKKK